MAEQKKTERKPELYNITNGIPDIAETARNHIAALVDGNGLKSTDVRITEKEQDIFLFNVAVVPIFQDVLSEKKIAGNQGAGDKCDSKDDMHQKIAVLKQQAQTEPATLSLLLEQLRELPFAGWGEKQKIILKELSKDYVYSEKCQQCQGSKKTSCSKCHGKGNINCFNCKGFGLMDCLYCDGIGQLPDGTGGQKECHKCYGKRKSKCTECHGKKYLICDLCRGSKYIPCKNCAQTGYLSVQTHVELEAFIDAPIDEKILPPSIWTLYEKVEQKGFATGGHAKIILLAPNETGAVQPPKPAEEEQVNNGFPNQTPEDQTTEPQAHIEQNVLYYQVELPMGHAEFAVGENRYKSNIVGYQSWIAEIDNFLDPLIKPGIKALQKMSQGPMAQKALIDKSLKYRVIKQVFSRIGEMPKGRILKLLKTEYPTGMSEKYAKAVVQFADKAIGRITEKPRIMGMAMGAAMAIAIFGAWFFVPLRKFTSTLPEQQQMLADIGLMAVVSYGSYYIVRLFAGKALKQFMSGQKQGSKQALPPAGNQGIYAAFIALCVFIVLAYFAPEQPMWLPSLGL